MKEVAKHYNIENDIRYFIIIIIFFYYYLHEVGLGEIRGQIAQMVERELENIFLNSSEFKYWLGMVFH